MSIESGRAAATADPGERSSIDVTREPSMASPKHDPVEDGPDSAGKGGSNSVDEVPVETGEADSDTTDDGPDGTREGPDEDGPDDDGGKNAPDGTGSDASDGRTGDDLATPKGGPDGTRHHDRDSAAESSNPLKSENTCGVCDEMAAKYKCPICYLPFCSVACNKTHKATHPPDARRPPASKLAPEAWQDADHPVLKPRPKGRFGVLETDRRVAQLFIKYPDLEDQLANIDSIARPSYEEKLRTRWTEEKGKLRGVDALRNSREVHPGVREFSELVAHLLSEANQDGGTAG